MRGGQLTVVPCAPRRMSAGRLASVSHPAAAFLLAFRPSRDQLGLTCIAATTLKKGRSQAEGNTLLNGQAGRRIEATRSGFEGIRRRAISGLWVALLLAI